MKQDYLSGIGNYLKAEILYVAKLSPFRMTNDLSDNQKTDLCNAINEVISKVLETNGRLLKYSDLFGKDIEQYKFKIYQRALDDDGNEVKCEETKDDRTTYWVPSVQL
jgi:formamidopyrimidine-DNA glycosylase